VYLTQPHFPSRHPLIRLLEARIGTIRVWRRRLERDRIEGPAEKRLIGHVECVAIRHGMDACDRVLIEKEIRRSEE
jgi:hypothetical protein